MHEIRDIPVKTADGKIVGKAQIVAVDGLQGEVHAQIVLDRYFGVDLMKAMVEGLVDGLSIGAEMVQAVPSFYEGRAEYGKGPARVSLPLGDKEIENRFGFHKATLEGPNASAPMHADARRNFSAFARWMDERLPNSREKEIAFERLEDASMWTHKSIARLASGSER